MNKKNINKKETLILSVTLGIITVVLVTSIFIQFRTVRLEYCRKANNSSNGFTSYRKTMDEL